MNNPLEMARGLSRNPLAAPICLWLLLALPTGARAGLTLEQAIRLANDNDPWLRGSELRQRAAEAESVSAGSLPDPMVDLGVANLPTDTFEFDQEPMTQFKVGISQVFPRGETLSLRRRQLDIMGDEQPHRRDDRRAQVAVQVAHLWLEAWRARESIRLIEGDRALFEDLVDVAQSSYSTALGRTRQQDLVRAQLELTRLEDRLAMLQLQMDASLAKLAAWLYPPEQALLECGAVGLDSLSDALPALHLANPRLCSGDYEPSASELAEQIQRHPAIRGLESRIAAGDTAVELAEQNYLPQWRLSASYAYRDDDPTGNDRADFFSLGVAFDLPLFTSRRQDRQVQSAAASAEALRTERWLALRNLMAEFRAQRARLLRLEERRTLYRSRLLEEMSEQAEASLNAYTNDDGDFAEVVRSRIAVLNAHIDVLDLDVERLKTVSQLNYYFATGGAGDGGNPS